MLNINVRGQRLERKTQENCMNRGRQNENRGKGGELWIEEDTGMK